MGSPLGDSALLRDGVAKEGCRKGLLNINLKAILRNEKEHERSACANIITAYYLSGRRHSIQAL